MKAGDEHDATIVLASVQTLTRPRRLERMPTDLATVVIDEAHHSPADSYRRILDHVRAGAPDGPLLVGVTATADRGGGLGLDRVFEEIVVEIDMLEMIEQGYLANLRALQIRLAADFERLHTFAGDFIEHEAEDLLLAADAPIHAVRAYHEHAQGRKTLVFTSGVALAHAMTAAFTDAGIAAAAVDGAMPLDVRRDACSRVRAWRRPRGV